MNWVGGGLQRSRRAGDLTGQQKIYFAKARAKHLHSVKPERPTRFFDDDPHNVGDSLAVERSRFGSANSSSDVHPVKPNRPLHQYSHGKGKVVTEQWTSHQSRSPEARDPCEKEVHDAGNGAAIDLSTAEGLKRKRLELLARPDWLGIKRLRPLQMDFPRQRPKIARRRHVTDEDRRRQGRRRPDHVPGQAGDAGSPLRREIRPDHVSVHFGTQAMLETQPTPHRRPTERYSLRPDLDVGSTSIRGSTDGMLFSTSASSQEQGLQRTARREPLPHFVDVSSTMDGQSSIDQHLSTRARLGKSDTHRGLSRVQGTHDLQRFRQAPVARMRDSDFTPSERSRSDQMLFSSSYAGEEQEAGAGTFPGARIRDQRPSTRHGPAIAGALAPSSDTSKGRLDRSPMSVSTDSQTAFQRPLLAHELRAAVERYKQDTRTTSATQSVSSVSLPTLDPQTVAPRMPDQSSEQVVEGMPQESTHATDHSSSLMTFPGDGESETQGNQLSLLSESLEESVVLQVSTVQGLNTDNGQVGHEAAVLKNQHTGEDSLDDVAEKGPSSESFKEINQGRRHEETSPFFKRPEHDLWTQYEEKSNDYEVNELDSRRRGANRSANPSLEVGSRDVPLRESSPLLVKATESEVPPCDERTQGAAFRDSRGGYENQGRRAPPQHIDDEQDQMLTTAPYTDTRPRRTEDEDNLDTSNHAPAAPRQQLARVETISAASDQATAATGQTSHRPKLTFKRPPRFSRGNAAPQSTLQIGAGRAAKQPVRRPREAWNIHTAGGDRETWELRSSAEESTSMSTSDDEEEDIEDSG